MNSRYLGLIISLCAAPALLRAGVESVGTTAANFLKIPPHARSAAMAESFQAISDDENALLYNPAGAARILQNQISATHIEWFQGIHLEHLGALYNFGSAGVGGIALTWLQIDDLIRTQRVANTANPLANYTEIGTFAPYDAAVTLGWAQKSKKWALGGSLRVLQQDIDSKKGISGSIDLGAQWLEPFEGLVLGVSLRNLGSAVAVGATGFQLPMQIDMGLAWTAPGFPLTISTDFGSPMDNAMMFAAGLEIMPHEAFALRAGYRGGFANQFTAGAGFRLSPFNLDYAYAPFNDLGNTHRITATLLFGAPDIGLKVERPLMGPVGDSNWRLTAFLPDVPRPETARSWKLEIAGPDGHVARTLSGEGPVPARLAWDGRDAAERPLPDGESKASLKVDYAGGISVRSPWKNVELDSTPRCMQIDVNPKITRPTGQALLIPAIFSMAAQDKNRVGGWNLEIRDDAGKLFRSFQGPGDVPAHVNWDGTDGLNNTIKSGKTYIARLYTRDRLGNRSASEPVAHVVLLKEVHFQIASDALFEVGKADVRISAYDQLKEMKEKILAYVAPGSIVEIVGHTDSMPVTHSKYGNNETLSLARAQAVVKFMTTLLGMKPSMFKAVGKGEAIPIAENESTEGREKNRRVEIILHGIGYE